MRVLKKIVVFVLVAIIIQTSVLLYLEKYYFASDTVVRNVTSQKHAKIKASENTKQFKVSFDGKYISYMDSNGLYIIDTMLGTVNKAKIQEGATVSFYKWLPDSNRIIFADKMPNSNGVAIKFHFYNAVTKVSEEVRGKKLNNSVFIQEYSINCQVTDIAISTLSNVIYAKILKPGQRVAIYNLENMTSINKTQIDRMGIGNIGIATNNDNLYFEDLVGKNIKTVNDVAVSIPQVKNPSILGTDNLGNIYVGEINNECVNKIYWGIAIGNEYKWSSRELTTAVNINNLYISQEGKIYVNDNLNGIVTEVNSGIKTEYPGIFKTMYDKGIASIEDGIITLTKFNEITKNKH